MKMRNKRLKELMKLASHLELSIKAIDGNINDCWRRWDKNNDDLASLQRRKELNWFCRWLEDIFYGNEEFRGQDVDNLFERNQQKSNKINEEERRWSNYKWRLSNTLRKVQARIAKLKKPIETLEDEVIENLISYLENYKSIKDSKNPH